MVDDNLVCVGAIAGAFGVRGEARIKSFTVDPTAIATYGALLSEDGRSFDIRIVRPIKDAYAARLSGVATREEAEALKGTRLYVPRERLPEPEEDEFYHADLIGLAVSGPGGDELGKVLAVHNFGAGDVIEISGASGSLMIPFTREAVPTVDLGARRIIVDPPEEH